MKKIILMLTLMVLMVGCTDDLNPEKILEKQMNPFKEYKVNDTDVAKIVEEGILMAEAESKGLEITKSSAHLISYKKIGEYGTGEVRILGILNEKGLKKINENRLYGIEKVTNDIINYSCIFEYSYKSGRYTWSSTFPYTL